MASFDLGDDGVVVVVGSGAGGGTVAGELAQKGVKTVVLDAGQRLSIDDFVNDEWEMFFKISWLDPRSMSGNASWMNNRTMPAWTCKTVGGTTVHWAGCTPRFQPHEFKALTTYGRIEGTTLLDWPLSYEELEPWYGRAEDRMGVTGTHGIPLLPGNNNFKVLYNGAKKLGYQRVSTGRMAINSRERDGRAACQQLGFCFQGCKMGAKWSTLYTEIVKGEATGNLEVRPGCMALRIEHDDTGKVTGVLYADPNGAQQLQKARAVCVAGNAIETPRLLLNSDSARFSNGLANGSGHVGRHYTVHTTGSVHAVFEQPVHMYRGTTMAGIVEDESVNDPRRGFVGGYHLEQISLGLPFTAAASVPGAWGEEWTEVLEGYDRMAGLWICGEDMPLADNRVSLDPEIKDQYGLPIPHVHFDNHLNNEAMQQHAYQKSKELYEAVGAIRTIEIPPYPAGHNMGTTRMSARPDDGVLDGFGRAHEVPNLFVSDGSTFTTSGAANPTLTIVALALRQADHIAGLMSRGEI